MSEINLNKKILLMYLGGETNTYNLVQHWINMNTQFINKDNFYVVIHPIKLENYSINEEFASIFNPRNIYIVNELHHIKTGWGTHSLTEATLLMMQYANELNNYNFFDKYVLLSSTCMPLYCLDEIYKELISDNKSWINGTIPVGIKQGNIKNITHNQWVILDKRHAMYFFNKNNDKFEHTYIKNNKINECPTSTSKLLLTQDIEVIDSQYSDKEYNDFFRSHTDGCKISDEYFIGSFVFHKVISLNQYDISSEEYNNNFRLLNKEDYINRLQNIPIKIKSDLKDISDKNKKDVRYLKCLPKAVKINFLTYKNNKNLYDSVKLINDTKDDTCLYKDLYTAMSTFVDLYAYSFAPDNIIRNFSIFPLNINEFLSSTELPSKTYSDILIKYNHLVPKIINCDNESHTFDKIALSLASHPVEYSCWTLNNMVNIYIFLIIFICLITNSYYVGGPFHDAIFMTFLLYQKIIFKEFDIKEYNFEALYTINIYEKIIAELDKTILDKPHILNNKMGTFIDNNIILSAQSVGSLFIRKCYDNSFIHLYSNILKTCKYNNSKSDDSIPIPIPGSDTSMFDPSNYKKYLNYNKNINLEHKYFKKYLLYKNKYLKLSKQKL